MTKRLKHIAPSIIAKNQGELEEKLDRVKDFAKVIHLDVMDGNFVQNESLNFDFILPELPCRVEAHLMVRYPEKWIAKNYRKADLIQVHYETCKSLPKLCKFLKQHKKQVGLVLNPETKVSDVSDKLKYFDQVLVMTVNPGFYGSPFLKENLDKIYEIKQLRKGIEVEVDGGITDKTIKYARDAGADVFVSGSYVMKAENPEEAFNKLQSLLK
ncbi:MAG: ribulose-phosphate 3-epimerase [Nanoarchaeota archaeon]|nr:ribulose-phosphate 3-epimerase [Nanoarchaeota archaeon]